MDLNRGIEKQLDEERRVFLDEEQLFSYEALDADESTSISHFLRFVESQECAFFLDLVQYFCFVFLLLLFFVSYRYKIDEEHFSSFRNGAS